MDFGLAKPLGAQAAAPGSGTAPPSFTAAATLSGPSPLTPLTTAGSIVGTIQYMSPEQIEGKEADARSDIFAFGAVLYEMVAGKRPFSGKSQISLASSILESDPAPISAVKPQTPSAFEHVVTTCLQKNPEERYQTAHDIKLELLWIAEAPPTTTQAPVVAPVRRPWLAWGAAAVFAVAAIAFAMAYFQSPRASQVSVHSYVLPPEKAVFLLSGNDAGPPVLSPDGLRIAFVAKNADSKQMLWIRPLNSAVARAGIQLPPQRSQAGGILAPWKMKNARA
ncbi:MAG: protein kinase [Candidatus Sulfotelmatobacter sp.]